MTSQDFVIWLKGFTEGVHEFNITPKQWDILKDKLGQVIGDDNKFIETPGMFQVHPEKPYPGVPVGIGGWGTPNGTDRYPWGGQKVWGGITSGFIQPVNTHFPTTTVTTGSTSVGESIYYPASTTVTYPAGTTVSYTVTTGSSIGVTTINDPFKGTTTTFNPQSGSWHYTDSNPKTLLND